MVAVVAAAVAAAPVLLDTNGGEIEFSGTLNVAGGQVCRGVVNYRETIAAVRAALVAREGSVVQTAVTAARP